MIIQKFLNTCILGIAMVALSACGDFQLDQKFKVDGSNELSSNNGGTTPNPNPAPVPSGGPVGSLSAITVADMELGQSQTVNFTITAEDDYSGLVTLAIDRTALSGINGNADVTFEFNPAQVQLVAGQVSQNIELIITSKVSAPSFNRISGLKVRAISEDGDSRSSETSFSIMVKPEITIEMYGLQDAMGNAIPPAERFNRPQVMNFRSHSGNLRLKFVNMDTQATHIVHGNNPIAHGSTANPLTVAADAGGGEVTPGGSHEPEIEPTDNNTGSYYYHGEEAAGLARTMNFHQANPSAASVLSLTEHEIIATNIRMLQAQKLGDKGVPCDEDPNFVGGE